MTTGIDTVAGTIHDDTFNATFSGDDDPTDPAYTGTFSSLDSIDGGAGTDTFAENIGNGALAK